MIARVATVVRCADLVHLMYATLASLESQDGGCGEIVLVTDDSTPAGAREWIERMAADRGFLLTHAAKTSPGSVRNAGIRATKSPYVMCIDAGDQLNRSFHESLADRLDSEPSIDVVTSSIQVLGPGTSRQVIGTDGVELEALLGNTDAIHEASMFRRQAWADLDGFDETLPALEAYEFWLRVLGNGRRCEALDRPLLIRPLRDNAQYRRAWEPEQHLEALTRIFEKHAALFARDPAAALYAREVRIQTLAEAYLYAVARRDTGVRELDALRARAVRLRYSVPASEQETVDLGDLSRTTPVARDWGYERGQPIDRHYIESFLEHHAPDIQGIVLEIQEPDYTQRFGGERVSRSDVLDLDSTNPRATVISDLRSANNVTSSTYDCVILTQTVHVIDDMRAALSECARILKPGGVLLATLPSASRVCLEYGHDGDFWRVTEAGARHLFAEVFPEDAIEVQAYGNVLVNAAFLYGLGCHELNEADFDAVDPYFPLLVSVRAQKPGGNVGRASTVVGRVSEDPPYIKNSTVGRVLKDPPYRQDPPYGGAVLLYHRVSAPHSDVHGLCVPPDAFRAQMAHLRDRYHPMPLGDLVAAAAEGRVPAGGIAVTFDDGYLDNYLEASPILSEHGVPATFFVTTDRLGERYEFWWDALERVLLSPLPPISGEVYIDLPAGGRTFATGTCEERRAAHAEIYAAIVGSPADVRDCVIDALVRWSGPAEPLADTRRRMTSAEILSMAAREGHSIGAHSVRHVMLPQQTRAVQRDEIASSRRTLESLLGHPVRAFAYPFGAYSDEVVAEVRAASFDVAVTCDESPVGPHTDPLRVPRFEVTPQRSAGFANWLAAQLARE